MPTSLSHHAYLVCFDTDRGVLDSASVMARGPLLRAAAIAELRLEGHLVDRDGRAVHTGAAPPSDPFLAAVLARVDRPRRWFGLVEHRWHEAEAVVRSRLATEGALVVTRRRLLGLIPTRDVTPTDPDGIRALQARVRDAVTGGHDPAEVPLEDAVLAVLCLDEADVRTVLRPRERRAHAPALRALTARVDAELPGLRAALEWSVAARRTAAA